MTLHRLLCGLTLVAAIACAQAHEVKLGKLTIAHPHARATVPGQSAGGAFLTVVNDGADDRLLGASAAIASEVQLHSMKMDGDVMRMRQEDGIALPAGKTVELAPGGLHIMFMGLKAPLKAGQTFPMKLRFEKAGEVIVDVTVEAAASAPAHPMKR